MTDIVFPESVKFPGERCRDKTHCSYLISRKSEPGSLVHENSLSRETNVRIQALLQGVSLPCNQAACFSKEEQSIWTYCAEIHVMIPGSEDLLLDESRLRERPDN